MPDSGDAPPSGPQWQARSAAAEAVAARRRLLERLRERENLEPKDSLDAITRRERLTDLALRELYARRILWILVGQLAVADLVFLFYAWIGSDWNVDPVVMQFWLGATVVEVVGIALVVTRYLFPNRA